MREASEPRSREAAPSACSRWHCDGKFKSETGLSNRGNMKSFEMGIITVFIKSSNRRQNHMAKNKETSHRGTGKGQKLLSGTRDQLIKDLRRVHRVFPAAEPDRDFYRQHGKYADAAWKKHFSRFKDFIAASGVASPYPQLMWHLKQVHAILSTRGDEQSDQEDRSVRHELYCIFSAMTEAMGVSAQVYVAAAREAAGEEDGAV